MSATRNNPQNFTRTQNHTAKRCNVLVLVQGYHQTVKTSDLNLSGKRNRLHTTVMSSQSAGSYTPTNLQEAKAFFHRHMWLLH